MTKHILILTALLMAGCRTPAFPVVDLAQADWDVREGQAIWRREASAPELVVDVIAARHPDGRAYLQVSKSIFPMVNVLLDSEHWWIEAPTEGSRHAGRGAAPTQSAWPQLATVLAGRETGRGWFWEGSVEEGGVLVHTKTGERLEVAFLP